MAKTNVSYDLKRFAGIKRDYTPEEVERLRGRRNEWEAQAPLTFLERKKGNLNQKKQLLKALSPERWLLRGFSIVRNHLGNPIRSVQEIDTKESLTIQFSDGQIDSTVDKLHKHVQ